MITIFLGSSTAAKSQAHAVIADLSSDTVRFIPWWDAFPPGVTILERLNEIPAKVDGALFLFSPEHEATIRKKTKWIPNLNVLFEFGYFYGRLGKERVAMLRFGDSYIPTDLKGYIHILGSKQFKRSKSVALNPKTKGTFNKWAQTIQQCSK